MLKNIMSGILEVWKMKTGMKFVVILFVMGMFVMSLSHFVKAEDDNEDVKKVSGSGNATAVHEVEKEDSHETWDFSDDFKKPSRLITNNVSAVRKPDITEVTETTETNRTEKTNKTNSTENTNDTNAVVTDKVDNKDKLKDEIQIQEETAQADNVPFDELSFNKSFDDIWNRSRHPKPINITIPEVNLSNYNDSDHDGVIDKYDKYPGQNDKLYKDSDGDGVMDAYDKYPGKNDSDYTDSNNNGIPDSKENIGTVSHNQVSRSFWMRILQLFGVVRG
jgi:hypothetical protein